MPTCVYCSNPAKVKYCNTKCQQEERHQERIKAWLEGKESGLRACGVVTNSVKRWLRETRGNACELCGWSRINVYAGNVPLTADHIDGNWQNNRPENLRLLCGSCDSLQPTYKNLNRGNGRTFRRTTMPS